jgi:hypothetical protein
MATGLFSLAFLAAAIGNSPGPSIWLQMQLTSGSEPPSSPLSVHDTIVLSQAFH